MNDEQEQKAMEENARQRDWDESAWAVPGSGEPLGLRNWITPAETERLAIIMEEMGEALQNIGKALRHGYESVHPADRSGPNNRSAIAAELGDVQAAIRLLTRAGDISHPEIFDAEVAKIRKFKSGLYLHHQPEELLEQL